MKILITHAYAKDNKGDAAILSVLLSQLQEAFRNAEIYISIFEDTRTLQMFEGYLLISNYMYFCLYTYKNILLKLAMCTYSSVATLLWAYVYSLTTKSYLIILPEKLRKESEKFLESDLIVPIGGGYLRAKKGIMETINLWFVLHPILIASLLKKPIVLYSQTIGPLATPFQKYLVRIVLNKTTCIMAREKKTVAFLKEIGVNLKLIVKTVDAAFIFQSSKKIVLSEYIGDIPKNNHTVVGVTVRNWLDTEKQAQYEREIASFIHTLIKDPNMTIVFIPQVSSELHGDDDRIVAKRIIQRIGNNDRIIHVTDIYDHHEIKALYSKLDYLVGTRFHSVIFALTAKVPALAIEYEYKTSGIMEELGLSEWVILIEEVTADRLHKMFASLVKEKAQYLNTLHRNMPPYTEKVRHNIHLFRSVYKAALDNTV